MLEEARAAISEEFGGAITHEYDPTAFAGKWTTIVPPTTRLPSCAFGPAMEADEVRTRQAYREGLRVL